MLTAGDGLGDPPDTRKKATGKSREMDNYRMVEFTVVIVPVGKSQSIRRYL